MLVNRDLTEDANFYVDKRAVYVYKGRKGQRIRTICGRITRVHGNSSFVRGKFHYNLLPHAIGKQICVMLYPSTI